MGKSRMALQLRELVAGDHPLWIEGSCSSYTRMSVLRPVIDLMEDALSFHERRRPGLASGSDPASSWARPRWT